MTRKNSLLPLVCLETLRSLEESLDGERDLSRNFVRRFVHMWPDRFARIHDAITNNDHEVAMDAVLSLRSASVMVGATRLGDFTTGIIGLIEAGQTATVAELLTALQLCGDQTMYHLKLSYINTLEQREE